MNCKLIYSWFSLMVISFVLFFSCKPIPSVTVTSYGDLIKNGHTIDYEDAVVDYDNVYTFVVTNEGLEPLNIKNIIISIESESDVVIELTEKSFSLAPGDEKEVSYSFNSTEQQPANVSISIFNDIYEYALISFYVKCRFSQRPFAAAFNDIEDQMECCINDGFVDLDFSTVPESANELGYLIEVSDSTIASYDSTFDKINFKEPGNITVFLKYAETVYDQFTLSIIPEEISVDTDVTVEYSTCDKYYQISTVSQNFYFVEYTASTPSQFSLTAGDESLISGTVSPYFFKAVSDQTDLKMKVFYDDEFTFSVKTISDDKIYKTSNRSYSISDEDFNYGLIFNDSDSFKLFSYLNPDNLIDSRFSFYNNHGLFQEKLENPGFHKLLMVPSGDFCWFKKYSTGIGSLPISFDDPPLLNESIWMDGILDVEETQWLRISPSANKIIKLFLNDKNSTPGNVQAGLKIYKKADSGILELVQEFNESSILRPHILTETDVPVYIALTPRYSWDSGNYSIKYETADFYDNVIFKDLPQKLEVGQVIQFSVVDEQTGTLIPDDELVFKSSDTEILYVHDNGLVTALKAGNAAVQVEYLSSAQVIEKEIIISCPEIQSGIWYNAEIACKDQNMYFFMDAEDGFDYRMRIRHSNNDATYTAILKAGLILKEQSQSQFSYFNNVDNVCELYSTSNEQMEINFKKIDHYYVQETFAFCIEKVAVDTPKEWTFMFYLDADNDLEQYIIDDFDDIRKNFSAIDINVVVLIDRSSDYSTDRIIFGENFSDTRLYRIMNNKLYRIGGGIEFPEITTDSSFEANMGHGETLEKFVKSCKSQFPANHYSLCFSNHGDGAVRGQNSSETVKGICSDDDIGVTSGSDILCLAEVSDYLSADESVDILIFDACLMAGVEIAYQYRCNSDGSFRSDVFSAKYMCASAPTVYGDGLPYINILNRLGNTDRQPDTSDNDYVDFMGPKELVYSSSSLTASILGGIIIEERGDVCHTSYPREVMSLFDLSKIEAVKLAVDVVSKQLTPLLYATYALNHVNTIPYYDITNSNEQLSNPYIDLYQFSKKMELASGISTNLKSDLGALKTTIDEAVVVTYGKTSIWGADFNKNYSGLSIFAPYGDVRIHSDGNSYPDWFKQQSYNASDLRYMGLSFYYGRMAWCADGATSDNGIAENWFEFLDSIFEPGDDLNKYNY